MTSAGVPQGSCSLQLTKFKTFLRLVETDITPFFQSDCVQKLQYGSIYETSNSYSIMKQKFLHKKKKSK